MWGLIIACAVTLLALKLFGSTGFLIALVFSLFVAGAIHTGTHYQTKDQG